MGIPTNIKTMLFGRVVEWARIEFKETKELGTEQMDTVWYRYLAAFMLSAIDSVSHCR